MKLLLMSDVHSNAKALQAIEQQERTWDLVLCAGDLVDYGFWPDRMIHWMRKHHAVGRKNVNQSCRRSNRRVLAF